MKFQKQNNLLLRNKAGKNNLAFVNLNFRNFYEKEVFIGIIVGKRVRTIFQHLLNINFEQKYHSEYLVY